MTNDKKPLLKIRGLKVRYRDAEVIRGLDLDIGQGECMGLVGESGCGKTTVGLSITKLIPEGKGMITSGEILLEGDNILRLGSEGLRKIRGRKVSYVFQEPYSSLNPVFTVHDQIKEVLADKETVSDVLKSVGLEKIASKKKVYPHELSGGMQQRVMIAIAIASNPKLIVLDEPTTALDVTVQNQILELIMRLRQRFNLSVLFISHDLAAVFKVSDKVAVMYAGKIIEQALKKDVISKPSHPYTIGLLESVPCFEHRKQRFNAIRGRSPLFSELPQGCKFHPRCDYRIEDCIKVEPELEEASDGHFSRCIRANELKEWKCNGSVKSN